MTMAQSGTATSDMQDTQVVHEGITPMMQQYLEVRRQHPGCLLFYRMGDFYEMFFEDAVCAAGVLDIALTKRGKHQEASIPMCGVPWHSHEIYLHKLIKAGYKVAICEQMESPEEAKKRGYKAVVRREVVRIVTPGTLVEEQLLDARQSNYLVCLVQEDGQMALAWVDMSTGEFVTVETTRKTLGADLARLSPAELLLSDRLSGDPQLSDIVQEYRSRLTLQVESLFEYPKALEKLKTVFGVATIESFGHFTAGHVVAAGALLEYLSITQKGQLPRLSYPKTLENTGFVQIDAATRRNLEIHTTLSGSKKGSLIQVIDKTLTGSGARLLRTMLASPLTSAEAIQARLDQVGYFIHQSDMRASVRDVLRQMPDMERALSRLCMQKGGPLDLLMVAHALLRGEEIRQQILTCPGMPAGTESQLAYLGKHEALCMHIMRAIKPEPGRLVKDGQFIADGYDPELDALRKLTTHGKEALEQLRDSYRTLTGIQTLKISHNNVLGYFIEITPSHLSKITDPVFIHRQTLGSAIRYTTLELKDLESKMFSAAEEALRLEMHLFEALVQAVMHEAESIALAAGSIAMLDVCSALAELAVIRNYVRPQIDHSQALRITGGRHAVIEAMMEEEAGGGNVFIANDCDLSPTQRLWLLTGPNMAGKSTFLRQNALIVMLAQMGSFVPAKSAYIGVVDTLFSRVGASDDLARGRSTFMVEMVETATILHQATSRSLVILDEIGRGTSTYDGLSIAWAVIEYLHNQSKCRALFATHYHELTSLAGQLAAMTCYTMQVKEWQGDVIFMHQVIAGTADRSYGIHVAKLAGLPKSVIHRATHVLSKIEALEVSRPLKALISDLPLFAKAAASEETLPQKDEIRELLSQIVLDELSPKDALDMLYRLVTLATHSG